MKRAREINLDPAYVYGLIRQESRFVMDARSHVGASGLMQVMPATARWTARKIGLTGFTIDQLNDRDTNIAIGTGYLKLVLDDFGGDQRESTDQYWIDLLDRFGLPYATLTRPDPVYRADEATELASDTFDKHTLSYERVK